MNTFKITADDNCAKDIKVTVKGLDITRMVRSLECDIDVMLQMIKENE